MVDPEALLRRIAVAVTPATGSAVIASSFHATSDRHAIPSHLHDLAKHRLLSVPALTRLATDRSLPIFDDGFPDVVSLAIEDEHQPGLLAALHVLASRTKDKLAVIWASRDDIEPPADAKSQNTEDKTAEEKSAENKSADDKSEEEKPKEDKSAEDKPTEDKSAEDKPTEDKPADGNPAPPAQNSVSKNDNEMTAPEITSLQVTGLIVGFVFLLIFLSGFMCLWKIQPPQSFAIFDSNDLKKKMQ